MAQHIELLEKLMNALGPSGDEGAVRDIIKKEIVPFVDEIKVDKFGNLIARRAGKGTKIMFVAHMDEIALMVKNINELGQMSFSAVGGVEALTLVGETVRILNNKNQFVCEGIVSCEELHEDLELEKLPKLNDLYIDAGVSRNELKKLGIDVGCYVIPTHSFRYLGSKKYISGKAVDDRVGCYVLVELIKQLKQKKYAEDLYFVFSVQEEIGLYGVQVSLYQINPDWGIAIDTTNAEDSDPADPLVTLGKGPVITLKDSEIITSKLLDDHIKSLAKKHKIPHQPKVEDVGTTDATKIMLHKEGLPSTMVGLPVRNIHSSVGIVHLDDITNCIRLLQLLLDNPPCMSTPCVMKNIGVRKKRKNNRR
ncbi:MAG: M42 family metallopeptidase [Candidatus Woesearchaeota archaeon]|nr:M42 family metallopeptidase [Candidatus Woesearchaeota archaeon]